MNIQQLLFKEKKDFDPFDFEDHKYSDLFTTFAASINQAFEIFDKDNKHYYDNTTRSNMLNNAVIHCIREDCDDKRFKFIPSLSYTRRSFGILDNKYVIMFKKDPVSNVKTVQDDLIKNQQLGKHILFLTYEVDDLWSEITKIEFRYYTSPKDITYTYDITSIEDTPDIRIVKERSEVPTVTVKENAKIKRKKSI